MMDSPEGYVCLLTRTKDYEIPLAIPQISKRLIPESLVLQEMFSLFRKCPNVEICVTKFVQICSDLFRLFHGVYLN